MKKSIRIIGLPIDLGQTHRGVDMGPSALRYAGLAGALRDLGYEVEDAGDIEVIHHYSLRNKSYAKRLPHIAEACEKAYKLAKKANKEDTIPLFLGGDHSAAIGSIGGVTHQNDTGVLWIDAHGDFNTPESSNTCNIHGMSLATLLGNGPPELVNIGRIGPKIRAENVVLIGIRDLDRKEKEILKNSGCSIFSMRDIDERGMAQVMAEALSVLANCFRLHVSLDMDSIDPLESPGVGTPVPGGLTYREAQLIMETICDTGKLASMDIMEVNPILDIRNKTAQVAVQLTASLFGKSIV